MKTLFEKIILTRENYQSKACISYVEASLPELQAHKNFLSEQEKQTYQKFAFPKKQHSYLLGRLSAKLAVRKSLQHTDLQNIIIDSGVFEFPVINQVGLQVSISHSENKSVSIAFPEKHPMGIDLELIHPEKAEVVQAYLTNPETNLMVDSLEATEKKLLLWTAKEALSKVLRTGLMIDFKFLEVEKISQSYSKSWELAFAHFKQYKAISFYFENYLLSIVLPKNTSPTFSNNFLG